MNSQVPDSARSGTQRVVGNTMLTAVAVAFSQACTAVIFLLAARGMGPTAFGSIATIIAVATISVVVFDYGLCNYLVREVASDRLRADEALGIVRAKRPFVAILVLPLLAGGLYYVDLPVSSIFISLLPWAIWEAQAANATLRSLGDFRRPVVSQVIARGLALSLALPSFLLFNPGLALVLSLVFGWSGEALLNRMFLSRTITNTHRIRFANYQRRASSFGTTAISGNAQQLDTPAVALGGDATAAGIYAAAGRLMGPLGLLSNALTSTTVPLLAHARSAGTLRPAEKRVLKLALLIALLPLAASMLGPIIFPLILGDAYELSGYTFAVFALGASLATVNQQVSVVLQNRDHQKFVAVCAAASISIGLVATYVLARFFGPVAAAGAYSLTQGLLVVLVLGRYLPLRSRSSECLT